MGFMCCQSKHNQISILQKKQAKKKGSLFREAKWVRTKPYIPRDWSTGWWWKKYRKQRKYPTTSYCIGVQNRTNCDKQRKRILWRKRKRAHTNPYRQCRVLGSKPGRFLWSRMYDIILCSPSPGTFASDRITCSSQPAKIKSQNVHIF